MSDVTQILNELESGNALAAERLAVIHYRRGEWQLSVDAAERARPWLRDTKDASDIWPAMAYYRLGQTERAERMYRAARQKLESMEFVPPSGKLILKEAEMLFVGD